MDADQLTLRKMTFDGIPYDDDWLVMWRGLNIGRILKQSGVSMVVPNWFWGINVPGMPQAAHWKGSGIGLADCQRQFKAAWATVRAGLSDEEIEAWRRRDAATGARINRFRP
jgi:hypothetical protein